jgi:hypothetical protein
MAKKKAAAQADSVRRPLVLSMRGNPEWKEWLDRLSKHCRMSTAVCVDQAVMEFAKMRGFSEPPPER